MKVDQATFRAALLDPEQAQPAGLTDGAGGPAGRRFDVYRNNVATSLGEALAATFPVTVKLVGAANFKLIAAAYLRAHPPTSPLMMFYGAEMPGFLARFGPAAGIGYLPDIARLEIALVESYHAADAGPVDPALLQALPPDRLMGARLVLAPSARLVRSDWPIHAIWRFNTQPGAPAPAMAAEDVVVLRPGFDPAAHLLGPGGGAFIAALIEGAPLGAAFEAAAIPDFDLAVTLSLLLGAGAITDIEEDDP